MRVKSGFLRSAPVFDLPIAGHRHQKDVHQSHFPAHPAGYFQTIHARQTNVEEDHFRRSRPGGFKRGQTVVNGLNVVSEMAQENSETLGAIDVIVHYQNAPG